MPAYTLEALDNSDIERILPYYFFDYRKALRAKRKAEEGKEQTADGGNTVTVNGRKYRRVTADKSSWVNNTF